MLKLLTVALISMVLLPAYIVAQKAPKRPTGIFGVRKNAIEKPQTYGGRRNPIKEDYFNNQGTTEPKPAKPKSKKPSSNEPETGAPTGGQQAIPEDVIAEAQRF